MQSPGARTDPYVTANNKLGESLPVRNTYLDPLHFPQAELLALLNHHSVN